MPLDVSSAPPQTTPRVRRGWPTIGRPAFLVDDVDLAFDLDEAATRVRSRLAVRRNPASQRMHDAPLSLDGEALTLVRVALNGEELGANRYHLEDGKLLIPDMPDAGDAGDRDADRAEGQHGALRPVHLERQLLHAMRGRGLPPHHLLSRSAGRDGALHHDDHGRQVARAGHAVERQSGRRRGCWQRPPSRDLDRSASQALLSVRAGRRRSGRGEGPASPRAPAGASSSASGCAAATRIAARMRCAR